MEVNSVSILGKETEVGQFPEEESAQTGGDGDTGEEDGGLAVVGVQVQVQGEVLGVLHQVDEGHEVTEQSRGKHHRPDHELEVAPVVPHGPHDAVVCLGVVVQLRWGSEGEATEDCQTTERGEEYEAVQQLKHK